MNERWAALALEAGEKAAVGHFAAQGTRQMRLPAPEARFYHSDGAGEAHFTFPCYTCHSHTIGFLPAPRF